MGRYRFSGGLGFTAGFCDLLTRMSAYRANATAPQSFTALQNVGPGAGITIGRGQALHFGIAAKMQGMTPTVDPASPAHQLEVPTSTRRPFARYEFGETSKLKLARQISVISLCIPLFLAALPVWICGKPIGQVHLIQSGYFDLIGKDMGVLRNIETACDRSVSGCREIFDLPQSFPRKIRIVVSDNAEVQIRRSAAGAVSLILNPGLTDNDLVTWVIRALLTRYGHWNGVDAPPPLWLVRACRMQIEIGNNAAFNLLLNQRLSPLEVPSLGQCVGSYDLNSEPGWDYLVYKFIESGGLDKSTFRLRILQFWKNGYDWSQLTAFFERTFPRMNPAELSLLWGTFVSEFRADDPSGFKSENESLHALERISTIEIRRNNRLEKVHADLWFLYRKDDEILSLIELRKSDMAKLILRVHPYYYNTCHSLNGVVESVMKDDLKGFQQAANQFKQDMLDAQQLSYEADRLIDRLQRDKSLKDPDNMPE